MIISRRISEEFASKYWLKKDISYKMIGSVFEILKSIIVEIHSNSAVTSNKVTIPWFGVFKIGKHKKIVHNPLTRVKSDQVISMVSFTKNRNFFSK
jgi:nucleoid DNA-binding protein